MRKPLLLLFVNIGVLLVFVGVLALLPETTPGASAIPLRQRAGIRQCDILARRALQGSSHLPPSLISTGDFRSHNWNTFFAAGDSKFRCGAVRPFQRSMK